MTSMHAGVAFPSVRWASARQHSARQHPGREPSGRVEAFHGGAPLRQSACFKAKSASGANVRAGTVSQLEASDSVRAAVRSRPAFSLPGHQLAFTEPRGKPLKDVIQ